MEVRRRILCRLHRVMVYWGLVKHPYGTEFVRENYTPTGGSSAGTGE